jgi:hypothetical protein
MLDDPFIRDVSSPLTAEQLRPLDARCRVVQFGDPFQDPLRDADFKKLAGFLKKYPKVKLRIWGHGGQPRDLDCLRYFPFVRRLAIEKYSLEDINGIVYACPDLEELTLGQTKSKRHSLRFLERFPNLRGLYLEGHTKDIDVLGALVRLEELTLRSITLPDLTLLKPLTGLHSLEIKLGGTNNLALLPAIGRLRYLELWMIRGLCDLGAIPSVKTLQFLFLQALKGVTELPSFAPLGALRRVHLETMKGLHNLRPVAKAPTLEELLVLDMRHLKPASFRPFVGHPALRRVCLDLGSDRRSEAVEQLLRLPTFDRTSGFRVRDTKPQV